MLSSGSVFGNSPLHDELYQSVVSGWNDKRAAPSKVLSNLTPFVELYCVFGSNDIIYNNNEPSRFTAIESRLCEVKLRNAEDKPFEDPSGNGITEDCKIARVGSTEIPITQLGIESGADQRRWTGGAGISDLAVSRGSAGSFNVKYDINMTLPDAELLNENYEYSKLMLLNSPFLIIYGWNIDPSQVSGGTGLGSQLGMSFPPKISHDLKHDLAPSIKLNNPNGGFWYASLVVLYKYEFSFDNVGHLGGKVSFITSSGNFLATIQTGAVASPILSRLTSYSEPTTQADRRIALEGEMNNLNRMLGGYIRDPRTGKFTIVDEYRERSGQPHLQDRYIGYADRLYGLSLPNYSDIEDVYKELPFSSFPAEGVGEGFRVPIRGGLDDLKEVLETHISNMKLYANPSINMDQVTANKVYRLEAWVNGPLTNLIKDKQARLDDVISLLRQAYDATASDKLFKDGIPFAPEKEDVYKLGIKILRDLSLIIKHKGKHPLKYEYADLAAVDGRGPGDDHIYAGQEIEHFDIDISPSSLFPALANRPWSETIFNFMYQYKPIGSDKSLFSKQGLFWTVAAGQNVVDLAYEEMAQLKSFISLQVLSAVSPEFGDAFLNEAFGSLPGSFLNVDNQNYNTFFGTEDAQTTGDPNNPGLVGPYRIGGEFTNTYNIIRKTTVLSVPLQKYSPAEGDIQLPESVSQDDTEGATGDKGTGDSPDRPSTPRFIPPAQFRFQPVYYFLGAVLEALRMSTKSNKATASDPGKIRFFYAPVPEAIGGRDITFPLPVPSEAKQQQKKEMEEIAKIDEEIGNIIKSGEKTDETEAQVRDLLLQREVFQQDLELVETFFDSLNIKTVYDIPVSLKSVNSIIMQNPGAPAHSLINQLLGLVSETIPAIRLATRPHSGDDSIIEIFIASIRKDNVVTEVFTELNLADFKSVTEITSDEKLMDFVNPPRIMVARFGHIDSLVENFNLSSKMDPNAFASFRLPAVIGGASVNIAALVADNITDSTSPMLGDIRAIMEEGLIAPKQALSNLSIIELKQDGSVDKVNIENLRALLESEEPALRKINATLVENLMAQNANFYNKVMALQAEEITNPGARRADLGEQPVKSFFGTVLSSFLRTATLTIHGTVGLNCFNYIYLKGLLSGIEGLYLISSVNESLTPGNFSTTLECKLMQYSQSSASHNPFAYDGPVTLSELSKAAAEAGFQGGGEEEYAQLVEDTNTALGGTGIQL